MGWLNLSTWIVFNEVWCWKNKPWQSLTEKLCQLVSFQISPKIWLSQKILIQIIKEACEQKETIARSPNQIQKQIIFLLVKKACPTKKKVYDPFLCWLGILRLFECSRTMTMWLSKDDPCQRNVANSFVS